MKQPAFKQNAYYHVCNFGVEKRTLFYDKEDFDRFRAYLYLLNDQETMRVSNYFAPHRIDQIYETARGQQLVGIGAYCLLPNRFDLLLTPSVEGGISKFMQRLQTAYAMYFNDKRMRTGRLFEGTYKSVWCQTNDQIKHTLAHIHLNPISLFDKNWDTYSKNEIELHFPKALQYEYSSINEYIGSHRRVVCTETVRTFIKLPDRKANHLKYWAQHKRHRIETAE